MVLIVERLSRGLY